MRGLRENIKLIKVPQKYNIIDRRMEMLVAEKDKLEEVVRNLQKENDSLKIIVTSFINIETLKLKQSMPKCNGLVDYNLRDDVIGQIETKKEGSFRFSSNHILSGNCSEPSVSENNSLNEKHEPSNCITEKYDQVHFLQDLIQINETGDGNHTQGTETFTKTKDHTQGKRSCTKVKDTSAANNFLTIHLDDLDRLKHQANLVLKENQLLMNQKLLYKETIDDLTKEFKLKVEKHLQEMSLCVEEKNKLKEELTLSKEMKAESEDEVKQLKKELSHLESRYDNLSKVVNEKMDISVHEEEMRKLYREKTSEIETLKGQNECLELKLEAMSSEKVKTVIQKTNLTAENLSLNMKLKSYERRETKLKNKLHKLAMSVEKACYRESLVRNTLSNVIKVAEKTALDRFLFADVILNKKEKRNPFRCYGDENDKRKSNIREISNDGDEDDIVKISEIQRFQELNGSQMQRT